MDRKTIIEMLREKSRIVTFLTKDGRTRVAKASLHPYLLMKIQGYPEYNDNYPKGPDNDQIRFIDMDLREWRSFNLSRLMSIE